MFHLDRAFEPELERRRQLRRLVVVSAAAHLALVLAMASAPMPARRALPPAGVVTVDLIAADALPGARPKPRARPKPPVNKVVLPAEPTQPKPAPAEPAPPKPAPEPVPKPVEQVALDDLLAELSAEREDTAPAQQVAGLAGAAGGSAVVDREVAAWLTRVRAHMKRNWILPPGFRTEPLQARVRVRLDAAGNVMGEPEIVKRSGNRHYDETTIRAIAKANPLPAPPEAGDWIIVFDPEDLY